MPNRIMVITAHPGDLVERAGGTSAKHILMGDTVSWLCLTTGAVSHAFDIFAAEGPTKLHDMAGVKARKMRELQIAAKILGVPFAMMFDYPESPAGLHSSFAFKQVVDEIRMFKPDTILTSHPTEYGRFDHMDAGDFVIRCVDYARAPGFDSPLAPHDVKNVFMFHYADFRTDQLMGAARKAPEIAIDITEVAERKFRAMMEFKTQFYKDQDGEADTRAFMERIDGSAAYYRGVGGRKGYAEMFTRLNPERYGYLPIMGISEYMDMLRHKVKPPESVFVPEVGPISGIGDGAAIPAETEARAKS